jgi:hypothetical protein
MGTFRRRAIVNRSDFRFNGANHNVKWKTEILMRMVPPVVMGGQVWFTTATTDGTIFAIL